MQHASLFYSYNLQLSPPLCLIFKQQIGEHGWVEFQLCYSKGWSQDIVGGQRWRWVYESHIVALNLLSVCREGGLKLCYFYGVCYLQRAADTS